MRKKKVSLKRRVQCCMAWSVLIAAFFAAAGTVFLLVWGAKNICRALFFDDKEAVIVKNEESPADSGKVQKANQEQKTLHPEKMADERVFQDPMLILVNKEHPLPEGYHTDLHLLNNGQYVSEDIYNDLRDMLFAGEKENPGLSFLVASGFRTSEKQQQLMEEEIEKNKNAGMNEQEAYEDALESVAPAGYSEHETGLCVDIVAESNQRLEESQRYTEENAWLAAHCAEYGFIRRYPEGKEDITGFMFESWHFRYVGKEAAKEITQKGITLEEYVKQLE